MVLLLVFLIIPTITFDDHHVEAASSSSTPPNKSPIPSPSPSRPAKPPAHLLAPSPPRAPLRSPMIAAKRFKCPRILREKMVARVLKRLKAPKSIKSILGRSAKFGICVARKFCGCLMLCFQPLVYGCLAVVGARCMKSAISDRLYGCTNSMLNTNHGHEFDEVVIGGFCYHQCMKTV